MRCTLKIFVIPRDRAPAGPAELLEEVSLEGLTFDDVRAAAARAVDGKGMRVRALSGAPGGFVAYLEEAR